MIRRGLASFLVWSNFRACLACFWFGSIIHFENIGPTKMQQTSWLAFSIERGSKTPVFEQICLAIRARAISGDLTEGSRLPPTRVFATELGVSRSTVVTAYEQLVAEGYLQSVQGSGYSVCAVGEVDFSTSERRQNLPGPKGPEAEPEQVKWPVPFEASQPDMRLFPHRQWAKTIARISRSNPQAMLLGGAIFGNLELRQAIAAHVLEWRGITASAQQIIVTAGATDALEICLGVLTQTQDVVGLEDPGYLPLRDFTAALGLQTAFFGVDEQGAKLPEHDPMTGKMPRVVVLTPSHQYPLGGAMSPSRRLDYIRWAVAADAWIIEDDYDSEFRYAGRPIPAMAGFDRLNRTIYIGSFSKIFSNSLRLGYAVVPETLADRIQARMRRAGLKASYMPQQPLADFMKSGEFYRHLRRVRRIYADRRKFLLERLLQDFGQYGSIKDPQAGMQIVLHLNSEFSDVDLAQRANDKGIAVQPLSRYAVQAPQYNGLILGFCGYDEVEMTPALDALQSCFVEMRTNKG